MKEKRMPHHDLDNIVPILIGMWRRLHKLPGPLDRLQTREFRGVIESIKKLQQGSDGEKSLAGEDYFSNPDILGAYLLYQWMIHYQQGLSLINEIPMTPRKVLDVCSGPASFAFAALRHQAQDVVAVDRHLKALELGAEVCGRYGMPITVRRWNGPKELLPVEGKFDLVILAHCLEELFPTSEPSGVDNQNRFISSLLQKLTPQGYLLIVENSFLEANRRVLMIRDHFVHKGVPVQAPCIWKGDCPALKTPNSPCYAQRDMEKPYLLKEFQRGASIHLSSLKMSYLILRHPEAGWPKLPDKALYRVISPPIESFQGKRYYLCGVDGKKSFGSHVNPIPKEAKAFEYLKRGELISIANPLEKPGIFDIIPGTSVVVEAACGKPLKEEKSEEEPFEF
jgi:SAM-dependent methyltransferase